MGSELADEEVKTAGPWSRLHDSSSPLSRVPGAARVAKNVYRSVADPGRPLIGRPGRTRVLSVGSAPTVQTIVDWSKKDGSRFTSAVIFGNIYSYDWSTATWTLVVTTANLATAAITLSSFERVSTLSFANVLVVSDGVNTMFSWDGTSGAGGLTKLTNAPVLFGPMTQHYGRIFGIKASDRVTLVWSEVLQPNTGYEAAGFANAWTVTQTDPDPMVLLIGSNDGLYVYRERSTTLLIGRPDLNFASSATRDAVDQSNGTASPWGAIQTSKAIFVPDADLRGQLFRPGGSPEPCWAGFADKVAALPRRASGIDARLKVLAVYHPTLNVYIVGVAAASTSAAMGVDTFLVYDASGEVPEPISIWTGWPETTAIAVVQNQNTNELTLMTGDGWGRIHLHGTPGGSTWDDDFTFLNALVVTNGTAAISHQVESQSLGFDFKRQWWFNRIDLDFGGLAGTYGIYYRTPNGQIAPLSLVVGAGVDVHAALGIEGEGRHISVGVNHAVLGEKFALYGLAVTAVPADVAPDSP